MEVTLLTMTLAVIALCGLVGAVLIFRAYPRAVIVVWAAVLFLVPVWIGVQAGLYFSALILVTILGIASASVRGLRWSIVDSLVLTFVVLILVATAVGGSTTGHLFIVLIDWIIPYVWGRVVLSQIDIDWVHGVIAAGAVVISFIAIVEFLSGTNLFVEIRASNTLYRTWSELQPRGGFVRAEASFGHSIALGSSLAIAAAFVAVAKWPTWVRLAGLALVVTAVGMTFSRIAIAGVILTVLLTATFLGARVFRIAIVLLVLAALAIGLPFIWEVFNEAGAEAVGSAEYRGDLISLLSDSSQLGITPSWTVLATGETYYGSFQSIDNALILTALRFGLLPVTVLVGIIIVCLVSVLRGQATPASIAIIAQIPAFLTVALITQYAGFVWFTAGLAVASYSLNSKQELIEPDGSHIDEPKWEHGRSRA